MNGYTKCFDNNNNKHMNLLANDKKLLKKRNKIWDKIGNLLEKGFKSEPVKYIKTKIKIYNNRVYANFQYNRIPKVMNIVHVYM